MSCKAVGSCFEDEIAAKLYMSMFDQKNKKKKGFLIAAKAYDRVQCV